MCKFVTTAIWWGSRYSEQLHEKQTSNAVDPLVNRPYLNQNRTSALCHCATLFCNLLGDWGDSLCTIAKIFHFDQRGQESYAPYNDKSGWWPSIGPKGDNYSCVRERVLSSEVYLLSYYMGGGIQENPSQSACWCPQSSLERKTTSQLQVSSGVMSGECKNIVGSPNEELLTWF